MKSSVLGEQLRVAFQEAGIAACPGEELEDTLDRESPPSVQAFLDAKPPRVLPPEFNSMGAIAQAKKERLSRTGDPHPLPPLDLEEGEDDWKDD